jgi:hypothetical protein
MRMYHGLSFPLNRHWALVRLLVGCLQMFGAAFSLTLFLWLGVHRLAVGAMIATGALTIVSRLLFRTPRPAHD